MVAKEQNYNVKFEMISDEYMVVSIAGPKSREVMAKLTDADVSGESWPFMVQKTIELAGVTAHAFRLSYTGLLVLSLFAKVIGQLSL